jgi:penicillin-insensitive murein endopeptidase
LPRLLALGLALVVFTLAPGLAAAPAGDSSARDLFAAVSRPAALPGPRVFGSYAKGCLAGAMSLAADGPGWQAMRLSRNRTWGHPVLIAWIERFAAQARAEGWPGLLVGDLAQPRGGPMPSGHSSHQIGLDVDLWLRPMPDRPLDRGERESMEMVSVLSEKTRSVDPRLFGPRQIALIQRAALSPEVERIFVHPGIKQALCRAAGTDRDWLRKVRPWWGHDSHFHVRLRCPANEPLCRDQDPPPQGDGCGGELASWLREVPWKPLKPPIGGPKPVRLAELPAECRTILRSP